MGLGREARGAGGLGRAGWDIRGHLGDFEGRWVGGVVEGLEGGVLGSSGSLGGWGCWPCGRQGKGGVLENTPTCDGEGLIMEKKRRKISLLYTDLLNYD